MLASLALAALVGAQPSPPFEFKDGDRVVWLGGTLVEREQRYGHWEAALIAANPGKNITVRNLGWSGDTVHGEARGRFDFANPDKCFRQLVDPALELKPTVIFICYGTNESFEGKDGLPKFEKGLEKLLDALKPAGARVALFTPLPFIPTKQNPDVKERNQALAPYSSAIRDVATRRGIYLADTNKLVADDLAWHEGEIKRLGLTNVAALSLNGMHLTEDGYEWTATAVCRSLGVKEIKGNPSWSELEPLRKAVVAKNEQFFNKWRPQNETYLFGFRKHEQGRNAKEMAEFDPFIQKAEDEIAKLRKGLK